ncbi:MAG: trehalase-like domain-containing protein, partial [Gemmatimonadales bacterium]
MNSLDLALIGNGAIGALVDSIGEIVWTCVPRFDGDPVFCTLLRARTDETSFGFFAVELEHCAASTQDYLVNTPVLVTTLTSADGAAIEITDFAPRFHQHGRVFSPMMLVRMIRRIAGSPRIRIRMRPAHHYGCDAATAVPGSNHIRYLGGSPPLRVTTDAPVTTLIEESYFILHDDVALLFGTDETVAGNVGEIARHFLAETTTDWQEWVRSLAIPFEWQ